MTQFWYVFSGKFKDGLFHFFVDDEHGEREISKENYWKWMKYFGLGDALHSKEEVQAIEI
jgi:hypothetical protein